MRALTALNKIMSRKSIHFSRVKKEMLVEPS